MKFVFIIKEMLLNNISFVLMKIFIETVSDVVYSNKNIYDIFY